MENKGKKLKTTVAICATLAAAAVICVLFGRPLIEFVSDTEGFRDWVNDNSPLSHLCFVGMVMLQVIVAILPGEPFEIAAGYVFGTVGGLLLYMLGVLLGSIPIILLVRKFGRRVLLVFFSQQRIDSLSVILGSRRASIIMFILMFIPGTPKDLITYFMGLIDMKLPVCFLICTVARLPSIVTSVIGGDAIGTKNYTAAVIVFAIAAIVSLCGLLYWRRLEKRHKTDGNGSSDESEDR